MHHDDVINGNFGAKFPTAITTHVSIPYLYDMKLFETSCERHDVIMRAYSVLHERMNRAVAAEAAAEAHCWTKSLVLTKINLEQRHQLG